MNNKNVNQKKISISSPDFVQDFTNELGVVIVTFKRQELLVKSLQSVKESSLKPKWVIVIDNENSPETKNIVKVCGVQGVEYFPMSENTGGSGGFSKGVELLYAKGAKWFFLIDDDVALLPQGLAGLAKWCDKFKFIQGQRRDYDGSYFYWQYHVWEKMFIPNPVAHSSWGQRQYKIMNTGCFEGGLFHRDVVEKIGFPDARFFIYWDDSLYGYLASKYFKCAYVRDFVLQRTRKMDRLPLGTRQLRTTSDMARFYIMRNRAHIARYLKVNGQYNLVCFAIGTLATLAKEIIRSLVVSKSPKSIVPLFKGLFAGRKIYFDKQWQTYKTILPPKNF